MRIKDFEQKKRVTNRLSRIDGQIRAVIQMIDDEESVDKIAQQLSAARSALTQTLYEEFFIVMERILLKRWTTPVTHKDIEELRSLLKGIR